jgi:hypothetical protein
MIDSVQEGEREHLASRALGGFGYSIFFACSPGSMGPPSIEENNELKSPWRQPSGEY